MIKAIGKQFHFARFLSKTPKTIETVVSNETDPNRNPFFQYSWGTWLVNDKLEKARRQTKFSIQGTTSLIQQLATLNPTPNIQPVTLDNGAVYLPNNLHLLGSLTSKYVSQIASIHEGKHHRVYQLSLANDRQLVLRIPYNLESSYSIAQKIKSEVATLDFLDVKLGVNVPKVLAYGVDKTNCVKSPFILMEYIPGNLLMKQWDPLVSDEIPDATERLLNVIQPISEFQHKVNSIVFNKFGSLYFKNDVAGELQTTEPYDGETNETLKGRWRIGPSVEKCFSKHKNKLQESQIKKYNGPWSKDTPHELMMGVADIELEALRTRLSISQAESSLENELVLTEAIKTFGNLKKIIPLLINNQSNNIPNVKEIFKPRLYLPDLDPLNVILHANRNDDPFFVDFEYACIKPFVYSSYPSFVAYSGLKIYDLHQDVPNYDEMDQVDKEQYKFMYYKTRNERLWETQLNKNNHELIAIASPHIKMLKSPYIQSLKFNKDRDYLYIEGTILQLKGVWEAYVNNQLCNATDVNFPITEYSSEFIEAFQQEIAAYEAEVSSTPFAASGGWVPQDMFNQLKDQGYIEQVGDNFVVNTEKILED